METQTPKAASDGGLIRPGTLLVVKSTDGMMAYSSATALVLRNLSPLKTITPEMDLRLAQLPIGAILLCLEYDSYHDNKRFYAKVLWDASTYEIFGDIKDVVVLPCGAEDCSEEIRKVILAL